MARNYRPRPVAEDTPVGQPPQPAPDYLQKLAAGRSGGYLNQQALLRHLNQQRLLRGERPALSLDEAIGGGVHGVTQTPPPGLQLDPRAFAGRPSSAPAQQQQQGGGGGIDFGGILGALGNLWRQRPAPSGVPTPRPRPAEAGPAATGGMTPTAGVPYVTAPPSGGGRVQQLQSSEAGVRKGPLNAKLLSQLEYAAEKTGLNVQVTSGGQPSTGNRDVRLGSHRHDWGGAADLSLIDPATGKTLDMRNPADAARMAEFTTHAVAAGATGVGAGVDYMGPNKIHVGGGAATTWGGAPWVPEAVARGRANPVSVPPGRNQMLSPTSPTTTQPIGPAPAPGATSAPPSASSPMPFGPGAQFLAEKRAHFNSELARTPGLRDRINAITSFEESGLDGRTRVTEALFNRALVENKTLDQLTRLDDPNSFYGPIRKGLVQQKLAAGQPDPEGNEAIGRVSRGSNLIEMRTDQGSPGEQAYTDGIKSYGTKEQYGYQNVQQQRAAEALHTEYLRRSGQPSQQPANAPAQPKAATPTPAPAAQPAATVAPAPATRTASVTPQAPPATPQWQVAKAPNAGMFNLGGHIDANGTVDSMAGGRLRDALVANPNFKSLPPDIQRHIQTEPINLNKLAPYRDKMGINDKLAAEQGIIFQQVPQKPAPAPAAKATPQPAARAQPAPAQSAQPAQSPAQTQVNTGAQSAQPAAQPAQGVSNEEISRFVRSPEGERINRMQPPPGGQPLDKQLEEARRLYPDLERMGSPVPLPPERPPAAQAPLPTQQQQSPAPQPAVPEGQARPAIPVWEQQMPPGFGEALRKGLEGYNPAPGIIDQLGEPMLPPKPPPPLPTQSQVRGIDAFAQAPQPTAATYDFAPPQTMQAGFQPQQLGDMLGGLSAQPVPWWQQPPIDPFYAGFNTGQGTMAGFAAPDVGFGGFGGFDDGSLGGALAGFSFGGLGGL